MTERFVSKDRVFDQLSTILETSLPCHPHLIRVLFVGDKVIAFILVGFFVFELQTTGTMQFKTGLSLPHALEFYFREAMQKVFRM